MTRDFLAFAFLLIGFALVSKAHAMDFPSTVVCPELQTVRWKLTAVSGGSLSEMNGCVVQVTQPIRPDMCYSSPLSFGSAPNNYTDTFEGVVVDSWITNSTPTFKVSGKYTRHFANGNPDVVIMRAQQTYVASCVSAICPYAQGKSLGFQTQVSFDRGDTTACVDDCVAERVFSFEIVPTGPGSQAGYEWKSTGANCSSQRKTNAPNNICRTVTSPAIPPASGAVSSTACMDRTQPKLISDGKRLNEKTPDPNDWEYSATTEPTLQDNGCVVVESGRVICLSSAPSSVRPDNGTPGTPATPDATVNYGPTYVATSATTVNQYSRATVINSTNYGSGVPPADDGQGESNNDGKCDYGENSNSADCKGDGEGEGDCDPATETCSFGDPGTDYDFGDWDEEIEQAEGELTAAINGAMAEAASMFTSIPGGAMALPCPAPVTVMGAEISFCMTQYEGALSDIRLILMLLGAILVVAILLR